LSRTDRPSGIFLTKGAIILIIAVFLFIGLYIGNFIDSEVIGYSCQPIANDIEDTEKSKFILIECKQI